MEEGQLCMEEGTLCMEEGMLRMEEGMLGLEEGTLGLEEETLGQEEEMLGQGGRHHRLRDLTQGHKKRKIATLITIFLLVSGLLDSNQRPRAPQTCALPTALNPELAGAKVHTYCEITKLSLYFFQKFLYF